MSWFDNVERLYKDNIKTGKKIDKDTYNRFFKGPWFTPDTKNPGEVQRDYASKQSIKTQTNKAKWKKGFIKTPPRPHRNPNSSGWL